MARKFYDKEIKAIVKLIETWSKPDFTWDSLCVACKKILGKVPTRQALSQHSEIVVAYRVSIIIACRRNRKWRLLRCYLVHLLRCRRISRMPLILNSWA